MSKQRIIDYVMNTPGNTNPNVLNSLLDEEMSGSGGGDVVVAHITRESGQDVFVCDMTQEEIESAKK